MQGEVELGYAISGRLLLWHIRAELSTKAYNKLLENIPTDEKYIDYYIKKGFAVKHLPPDLSFDAFWNAYEYKVGNRTKCKQLWNKLTDGERIAVLESIPKYNRWLKLKVTVDRIYPERYLSQKRYENEFK